MVSNCVGAAMSGYALARMKFRGKRYTLLAFLLALLVPGETIMISQSLMMRSAGLTDTLVAVVRPRAVEQLLSVVDAVVERGLAVAVDGLQGHLSSFYFRPSWTVTWHRRNLFTDPDVVTGALAEALRDRPNFLGMTLGNEFNQFSDKPHPDADPATSGEAEAWLTTLLDACEEGAPGAFHTHCEYDAVWYQDGPFTPAHAARIGAATNVHSWVFNGTVQKYGPLSTASVRHAEYQVELAADATRPVWLQEVGAPSPHVPAELVGDFAEQTVHNALTCANGGARTTWTGGWWTSRSWSTAWACSRRTARSSRSPPPSARGTVRCRGPPRWSRPTGRRAVRAARSSTPGWPWRTRESGRRWCSAPGWTTLGTWPNAASRTSLTGGSGKQMHDDRKLVEDRVSRVLKERVKPAVYSASVPAEVAAWTVPGEPVPVAEGLAARYTPVEAGYRWGPAWGTSWFRIAGTVPAQWAGRTVELVIDLGFDDRMVGFQCEGLVYRPDGTPVKGLNPRNMWLRLDESTSDLLFYVEAAANPVLLDYHPFQPTEQGDRLTSSAEPLYRIREVSLAVFEDEVWQLVQDIEVLDQLMRELSPDSARRWEILRALDRAMDAIDLQDVVGTASAARAELAEMLARPASASAHRIVAVGHSHIDSAWLWPTRETVRKVARTTSNVTSLMDSNPEFMFAMSSAQQLAWIAEHHPRVFERVKAKVAAGQFVPVGGMWVESDTNMPGGEAMARQFVHGKRFFLENFGVETEEVWLPDSFGYSAAMPQLVTLSASKWFLTQKISWNTVNKFPHHTFNWEGIDGTRVFTHFPPADTYNSEFSGKEMAHAARNFQEKGRATVSLVPFGWGDGGGGPTREMLARAARLADLEGSPRVTIARPAEFFQRAQAEYPDAPVWVGELYLEFHRGTYTSQARTKQGNRRSEHLLREAELWAATAAVRLGRPYPYERLDRIWKVVLLNQFHDILPGSSIAWVHREAEEAYAAVAAELTEMITDAQQALAGEGGSTVAFNAAPHSRDSVPAGGASVVVPFEGTPVQVGETSSGFVLDNGIIKVVVGADGLVTSVWDVAAGREVLAGAANLLQLHPDFPNMWDAWDVDSFYRNSVTDLTDVDSVVVEAKEPDRVALRITRSFSKSTVSQLVTLRAGSTCLDIDTDVDWHETEKFLKLTFPLDVRADRSASEIQFGHVYRPTHTNTSWDAAKFEICAHRWVHIAEPGYGVALVNDSTYGHDVTRTAHTTTVRASLLRAPRFPDPRTDHGPHKFRHALVAGAAIPDAVREGYRVNLPTRTVTGSRPVRPLVFVDNPNVVVESVKLADDQSGDVVVRLYESAGGRARAQLVVDFPVSEAFSTDLLERRWSESVPFEVVGGRTMSISLRPFEILTLRLSGVA
ncbi:glycoside hydrolase family 38 C-terminal domain-containing protein [Actinocrispum wychmicini]|uniref:alpha-mannosidase n=1 Tax=Actinocrispum wychmicini TaxID=1213861 RepID=A0A4R2JCA4_9PSEU|nr:glycoside hydrolase family 38 C-terminal domain-containing protein [Actinocrispum wychmicini]TCO53739.1 alpha-mannosidase [Actinocrispum wychmicini]